MRFFLNQVLIIKKGVMRTNFLILVFITIFYCVYAQTGNVGINTETPSATLDINGNLKIRATPNSAVVDGHKLLMIDNISKEVKTIDASALGSSTNNSIAKAEAIGNGADLGLTSNNGYQKINFLNSPTFSGSAFNLTNDVYTVPANGIYAVKFIYKYGDGIQAGTLAVSGYPRIGVFNGATMIEETKFSVVNAASLSILSSTAMISSVFSFSAGDEISFHMNPDNTNIDLLSNNIHTSAIIYKISD